VSSSEWRIARALVHNPHVILADEPTGSLDRSTGTMILRLLFNLVKEAGVTLVVVTHEPLIAAQIERVLELSNGALKDGNL